LQTRPRLALVYDAFDGARDDLAAYLGIVSELGASRVADIGCGTGNLAVLLAGNDAGRLVILRGTVVDDAVAEMSGEPGRLPGHRLGRRRIAGQPVDGSREVQGFLDFPDLLVLTRRAYPFRVTHRDQPMGTVVPGGRTVLTCTTPPTRTSPPVPATDPGNRAAPVARKQPSPTCAPLT
jgi:SAM-dependent methyltransferase